jgi:hypothetical protein
MDDEKTKLFIEKARNVHGDKYDYTQSVYNGNKNKIKIICKEHGEFYQTPLDHYGQKKCGCRKCSGLFKMDIHSFIIKSNIIHKSRYDYSKVVFIDRITPVEIICKIHGSFFQTPKNHLSHTSGHGCSKCKADSTKNRFSMMSDEFENRANKIHNNYYSYPEKYINIEKPLKIICPLHGEFYQRPNNHLKGHGCAECKQYKCEKITGKIIEELFGIKPTHNHIIRLSNRKRLYIDYFFNVKGVDYAVEYNGLQHYQPVEFFGGLKGHKEAVRRDKIKEEWCKNNNTRLITIDGRLYNDYESIKQYIQSII